MAPGSRVVCDVRLCHQWMFGRSPLSTLHPRAAPPETASRPPLPVQHASIKFHRLMPICSDKK
jgi:hypothetical protein